MSFKEMISPDRLKTVPLSISGVLTGILLAVADYHVDWKVAVFLIFTVVFLHLRSSILTALSVLAVAFFSFGTLFSLDSFVLMIVGYFVIRASKRYADGCSPGAGMLFSILSVWAGFIISTRSMGSWLLIFPSLSIGSFTYMALRIRSGYGMDMKKNKTLNTVMTVAGWAFMTVYSSLRVLDIRHFLYVLTLPLFIWFLYDMWTSGDSSSVRRSLILEISILLFSILSGFGFLAYLI